VSPLSQITNFDPIQRQGLESNLHKPAKPKFGLNNEIIAWAAEVEILWPTRPVFQNPFFANTQR